jgi:hypothetical protein
LSSKQGESSKDNCRMKNIFIEVNPDAFQLLLSFVLFYLS